MPSLAEVPPELRTGPFTWATAQRAGFTKHQLRTSQFRHVFREVWCHVDVPDDRQTRLAAARLVIAPRGILCGLTAAWVHGADVRREDDLDVHVAYPPGRRRRNRPGVKVSQETLSADDACVIDGVWVTTPVRTVFDCLRLLPDPLGLVVADALTHLGLTSVESLGVYFAGQRRLRNLRVAERLVADVEPLSESPMETRTRVRLVRVGLPRPVAQHVVRDQADRFVARLDLAYPHLKIAIEYDGAWHWESRMADERRRARLRELGWTVIVVSAEDLKDGASTLIQQVAAALRRAAA
jgi:hypothetical protein